MQTLPLVFRNEEGRTYFEFHLNNQLAYVEYEKIGAERIVLIETWVSPLLEFDSVGEALIQRVLDHLYGLDFEIISVCPHIKRFLRKKQYYQRLVSINYRLADTSRL